ncbi:MAG: outer membrane lipoprotein-sorting protein [Brevinematales bacterium]|nr:outer membrane lipoprotein-sorting protein [Brevinematales bacterium]
MRLCFLFLLLNVSLYSVTVDDIIDRLEKNEVFESQKATAKMIIQKSGKKLTKTMKIWGVKEKNKFFVEFTNPEDKGVKYLRIDKELWIYFPDADDIMKISGHMLRQGMMGSDVSYEDLLSDEDYKSRYDIKLIGETNGNYILEFTAKPEKKDITYHRQLILVDKERFVATEIELFAKSGRLLKKMNQSGFKNFGDRWYPTIVVVKDMKTADSLTTVEFSELEFDIEINKNIFSLQNLKK